VRDVNKVGDGMHGYDLELGVWQSLCWCVTSSRWVAGCMDRAWNGCVTMSVLVQDVMP
jgi:hypothetical protein